MQVSPKAVDVPVLIVGAGPVGLTLSIDLAKRGVRHMVLGDALTTSTHPKCNMTNARSMEHFRRLGLSEKIRFGGLPADYPADIVYITRLAAEELARVRFPSAREAVERRNIRNPWPTPELPHRISQIFIEKILIDAATTQAEADIRQGWRVNQIEDFGDRVLVHAENLVDGEHKVFTCRWLVGCDGGRSTVRKQAGIAYMGESAKQRDIFGGTMIATYYESPDLGLILGPRRGFMYWTLNSEVRSVTVTIDGENRFLTHIQVPEGADPETIDIDDVIARIVGKPIALKVLSSAVWNAGFSLVADTYVKGNVFLAGDAAHLFTPTGGFGMNTGIDDVANLAWKLAACEKGWGGARLLESYDLERRPIGHRNTSAASKIADVISGFRVPRDIEDEGPAGRAARDDVAAQMSHVAVEEFQTIGIQLGVRYENSPLISPDGTPPGPDQPTRYVPSARPGARLPHVMIGERPIYDLLGLDFTLLDVRGDNTDVAIAVNAARKRGIPISAVSAASSAAETLYGASIVLVRPDQHVAWRGQAIPSDFVAILDRARGMMEAK